MKTLTRIWNVRYFWMHLALSDLRAKFRRSYFGILWAILNPLLLTLLMTFVMSTIFNVPPGDYAPYVFSGLIIWDVIVSSSITGCTTFVNAEGYIKQYPHPLMIYPIRNVLVAIIHFGFGFIGLFLWILFVKPENLNWTFFWCIPGMIVLALIALPLATICGILNTKFRDFAQLVVLIFQAIWYISPIFISVEALQASRHLAGLVNYNPVYHILNIIRAPILHGQSPVAENFIYAGGVIIIFWLIAFVMLRRNERTLIFYL